MTSLSPFQAIKQQCAPASANFRRYSIQSSSTLRSEWSTRQSILTLIGISRIQIMSRISHAHPSPNQWCEIRVLVCTRKMAFSRSQVGFIWSHMLHRISMSSFKPINASLLSQMLKWSTVDYEGQKVKLWSTCSQNSRFLVNINIMELYSSFD